MTIMIKKDGGPEGLRSLVLRFSLPRKSGGSEDRPLVAADVRAVF
jgi:hypothetical protein